MVVLALPKGELFEGSLSRLEAAGLDTGPLRQAGRRLIVEAPVDGIRYLLLRPSDVPTYVEYGAADLGIVGKDVLLEQGRRVMELEDLDFGECRFVVARPRQRPATVSGSTGAASEKTAPAPESAAGVPGAPAAPGPAIVSGEVRVATKYPRVASEYYARSGVQAEIIRLRGSVELAPDTGLADEIVDLAATGRTLEAHGLEVVDVIHECSARLIANHVSHRLKSSAGDLAGRLAGRPTRRSAGAVDR